MMNHLRDFLARFDSDLVLNREFIVRKENRYYLLNRQLRKLVSPGFFYAGTYLGKVRKGAFFPSLLLLRMMAKGNSNRTTVDAKAEWLYICGRDIFRSGIIEVKGSQRRGAHTLVLNQKQECLGFGRILKGSEEEHDGNQPTIKNVLDIGDLLRRERRNARARPAEVTNGMHAESSHKSGQPRRRARKHYK